MLGKLRRWLALCVVAGAGCLTKGAGAQAPDPHLVYRTLRTEHFEITYHAPLGPVAQRLGVMAERANSAVGASLGFASSQRTLVLLTDDSDDANGIASVIPRNEIHLFAAAPEDLSSIGDYDDWTSTLVTHEYTHILHLDQIGGIYAVINAVLGKTLAPNTLQPQWFIEGLAVYEESEHSAGGRMRSTLFDMYLRMDALDDRLLTLAQISNDPIRWPHGDIRYLYGSQFVGFIARRYGEAALHQIGHDYGRQWFPYGLNRVAKRATGSTYVELYDQFRSELRQRYARQRERVLEAGLVSGTNIVRQADVTRYPSFLRDGTLVYYADDGRRQAEFRTRDGRRVTRASGESTFAPEPNGRFAIYSQVAPHRDIYFFHDLYRIDLETGESERLTEGQRASQPDVSPNGREVAFVSQASGTSHLEIAGIDDVEGSRRKLLRSAPFDQVFTPHFSPDGTQIAISAWRRGGYRDILLVDAVSGAVRELTRDRAVDTGPTWSPDGQRIYFSSDRSGIANIYAFELATGLVYQVTNVLGGAYQPVISPDGERLVYVDYGSRGYGLAELPLSQSFERPAELYRDERPLGLAAAERTPIPSEPYSPWSTLLPYNYLIDFAPGAVGQELSVEVSGNDLANFHSYSLRAGIAFDEPDDPQLELSYSYNRMPLRPTLRLFRRITQRDDLSVAGRSRRWTADAIGGSLGLTYVFQSLRRAQSLDLSYSLAHLGKLGAFGGELDPNDPPPRLPALGWLPSAGFSYRYSDVTREAYDISPSRGRTLTFRFDVTDPIMGRDLHTVSARWEIKQYLALPWPHHVFALRYAGGLIGGDPGSNGSFTLGGFPASASRLSLYDLLVFGSIPSLDGNALRGYPEAFRSGSQFHQLQAEYRLPIFDPEWGLYTLPLYLRRLWATVFADAGNAFSGPPHLADFVVSAGAELFAQIVVGYQLSLSLRIGVARGFNEGGETQFYMHVGSPF